MINDGKFTLEEMLIVKMQFKEGRKSESDNIPSEVLKRCKLDDPTSYSWIT